MTAPPLTPEQFAATAGVSRETLARLRRYAELLTRWQARINLVGAATLPDLWRRHMLDSAQLVRLIPPGSVLLDLGSGAGFPGLVLAALGAGPVHLVESDARKCAFLREAARSMALAAVTVHHCRIEALDPFPVEVVTARAVAPVAQLLAYAAPFLAPRGRCLFLKGRAADDELTEASKEWNMAIERIASLSDSSGLILRIEEVQRGRAPGQRKPP